MNTIRSIRVPLLLLFVLIGLGAASLAWSAQSLPANVASHFNARGQVNGWMTRAGYLHFMVTSGLLAPLLMLATGLLARVLPSGMINLPQREYWLSPERRPDTANYLARHMAWLACMMVTLFIALNWLTVEANRESPPRLSDAFWLSVIAFLAGVAVWIGVLIRHFSRKPASPA